MTGIGFAELSGAINRGSATLRTGARLILPSAPDPFVGPMLAPAADQEPDPLSSEIVVIRSPAAVGKSTLAKALAADRSQPLLDLAVIPVSTDSLAGLLTSDVTTPSKPIDALHAGELCVVIDALDEGRLLSGENNFQEFLESTWDLLSRDRSSDHRPKLLLFGRGEAVDDLVLSLELFALEHANAPSRFAVLDLDFFEHDTAFKVVEAHAEMAARDDGRAWNTTQLAQSVIEAYFDAIEEALRIDQGSLWIDANGRAFAGYAPVLAAVGRLIGQEGVLIRLKNALESAGESQAWGVIEAVTGEILLRERGKVADPLGAAIGVHKVPDEAYDAEEQLTLLSQLAENQTLQMSDRVRDSLSGDLEEYWNMVRQHLPEHPFLQQGRLVNEVFTSIVLAHSIVNDLVPRTRSVVLSDASRKPFLWRSIRRSVSRDEPILLDGRYVGYILNSLWIDSTVDGSAVTITDKDGDSDTAKVHIVVDDDEWRMSVLQPVVFYERIQTCHCLLNDGAKWQGHQRAGGASSFTIRGEVSFSARELVIDAETVRIEGKAWLDAEAIQQTQYLRLILGKHAATWWSRAFSDVYPWSDFMPSLDPPIEPQPSNELQALVKRCDEQLGMAIDLYEDYSIPADNRFNWVSREFSTEKFSRLIRVMVEGGAATTERMSVSGPSPMIKIHFSVTWGDLYDALRSSDLQDPRLASLVSEARQAFDIEI